MQTFNLDLSNKQIQPLLNAKQGEVGRKFRVVITDGDVNYDIPEGAAFSAWYSGAGGDGNYTAIGDRSAFSIDGNTVSVELITQMLNLPGKGELCLTMDAGGTLIGTWNIPYLVEAVPGMGSKEATQYFNILKESAERAAASAAEAKQAAGSFEAVAIACDAEGELITLKDSSDLPLSGLKIFGKTTQDGTPTPDAPVELVSAGDSGSIGVTVCSKNLLNLPPHTSRTTNGIHFSASDGGVRMVGTSTATYAQNNRADHDPIMLPPGTYTLKMEASGTTADATFGVMITRDGANMSSAQGKSVASKTIVIEEGHSYGCFALMVESGKTVDCVVRAMLVPGEEDAEWEEYIEPQATSVSTPNGLPGIPVSSGGNYTDETGQQWLCDEIDLARGVYVQNIYTRVFDGAEAFVASGMTSGVSHYRYSVADSYAKGYDDSTVFDGYVSHFGKVSANGGFLGKGLNCVAVRTGNINFYVEQASVEEFKAFLAENPVTLMCPLAEPIEKDLTADQIAAFTDAAMHTYKPNATVYNDAGTGMKVSYVADPKTYIDNKFAELAAAIVNNT